MHYAKQSDIQMAAMLCCAFGCRAENQDTLKSRQLSKSVNVSVSITVIVHYSMCLLLHFQLMECGAECKTHSALSCMIRYFISCCDNFKFVQFIGTFLLCNYNNVSFLLN